MKITRFGPADQASNPAGGGGGGPVGGDLGGTTPNPTVSGLQGTPVSTTTPADRDALIFDAGTGEWTPEHVQAEDVDYDPTASGLTATEVQAAIDELAAGVGSVSPLTTKGDIWGFSTVDARLPVGANGSHPRADSTAALGIIWSTLHWEPHVAYDGTVVLNGLGDPVMVEVT